MCGRGAGRKRRARGAGLPAGALVLAASIGACGGPSSRLPADASPAARAAVEACAGLDRAVKRDCYEERLLARLAESGVEEALGTLETIAAADVEVERDGHIYTHAIGIEAYDPDRPVTDVFSRCTSLFQSGCYHGVIQAHFMAAGEVTAPLVRDLCEPYEGEGGDRWVLFQCLHGMGHGLTMFYGHHLPRALEDCDLLESAWDRESCYGGAFMENIMNATNPHHPASELASRSGSEGGDAAGEAGAAGEADGEAAADGGAGGAGGHGTAGHGHEAGGTLAGAGALEPFEPLREEDPHYPCSVLDRRYKRACYMMQTSAMLWHSGGDIGAAAESCADAAEPWRRTCYQSLGRDISSYTLQDPEESLRACRMAPAEYREWCYVGLVKNFIDLTARTDDGFAFCREVEEEAKPRCYEAVGEQIAVLRSGREARRELCERGAEDAWLRACLQGARVGGG